MTSEDDFALLDAWRAGDDRAGNELFERHFDSIHRFFDRKVGGDAADLVQVTFLGCIEARDRFRGASSFRTFLFSVARNQLYRHYRSKKKRDDLDFEVTSLEDLGPTPTGHLAGKQEQRLMLEALRSLPLDLQIALELHYWEGMRGPELAEVLDVPEGTVRSRLRRGKEQLTERLEQLASSPSVLASTVSDLEGWAKSLRDVVGVE